ncbi:MAG: UDP-N-acetylmuramoyl-L-alanine--D-glutamate ligase [Thiobacillaceae bacterium]|nr:UDP-N-acetylmuramoyl-L-alanine--D-glutamate ligase [Thiobacillaceae bacterium]MBP9914815.1 UDP-N-acetylmuramoyl-L-alanine--D-glutamate ligase [Thiobacillaceae bacterium]
MTRTITNYAGCKALVVGLGDTGASCVRWLIEHDAQVRATDTREEPPHAQRIREAFPEATLRLGGFDQADFAWADLIVSSPGVALATPELQWALKAGKDVVGDVELFARALQDSSAYVIAITGSNGKSTVTSLVGHLCAAVGLDTVVAGNIGLPVLDALDNQDTLGRCPDVWVLELSSFQLETTSSLKPDAATVLNISQDHMDRYAGLEDYAAAKARIFGVAEGARCKEQGARETPCIQVLNRDDPMVMTMARPELVQWTFGIADIPLAPCSLSLAPGNFCLANRKDRLWLCEGDEALLPVDKLPIAGLHNAANALAALALCRGIGLPYAGLVPALKTFEGLPHRVQKVGEVAGRAFYDDSKGTNVGATAAALLGFTVPVVLIAGGDGKGQDFSPLGDAVKNARAVVQIGRDGPLVEAAIGDACPVHRAESMEEAVELAYRLSRPGDAVLLSPACASWDMFRNYAHRAEVFIAAVKALGKDGHVS